MRECRRVHAVLGVSSIPTVDVLQVQDEFFRRENPDSHLGQYILLASYNEVPGVPRDEYIASG
jgi:hypothetical protein